MRRKRRTVLTLEEARILHSNSKEDGSYSQRGTDLTLQLEGGWFLLSKRHGSYITTKGGRFSLSKRHRSYVTTRPNFPPTRKEYGY
jgi:hypothetical protein